jgi:hypothetical protein
VADLVVDEGGDHGGLVAEAFAQAARGVVFAAAFPDGELAGGADAALAGIEAEHDFAEGDLVEMSSITALTFSLWLRPLAKAPAFIASGCQTGRRSSRCPCRPANLVPAVADGGQRAADEAADDSLISARP